MGKRVDSEEIRFLSVGYDALFPVGDGPCFVGEVDAKLVQGEMVLFCIEQGILVVIMLELEKDHKSLKCPVLSRNLGVSPTYLQKILHRMVKADIVSSSASKEGGYTIARKADRITIADIMDAVDETIFDSDAHRLARNLFGDDPHVQRAEQKVSEVIHTGLKAMRDELAHVTIEDLLEPSRDRRGSIEWEARVKEPC